MLFSNMGLAWSGRIYVIGFLWPIAISIFFCSVLFVCINIVRAEKAAVVMKAWIDCTMNI